jgi:hypothetical protein
MFRSDVVAMSCTSTGLSYLRLTPNTLFVLRVHTVVFYRLLERLHGIGLPKPLLFAGIDSNKVKLILDGNVNGGASIEIKDRGGRRISDQ